MRVSALGVFPARFGLDEKSYRHMAAATSSEVLEVLANQAVKSRWRGVCRRLWKGRVVRVSARGEGMGKIQAPDERSDSLGWHAQLKFRRYNKQ
jgi:hypothetical protein